MVSRLTIGVKRKRTWVKKESVLYGQKAAGGGRGEKPLPRKPKRQVWNKVKRRGAGIVSDNRKNLPPERGGTVFIGSATPQGRWEREEGIEGRPPTGSLVTKGKATKRVTMAHIYLTVAWGLKSLPKGGKGKQGFVGSLEMNILTANGHPSWKSTDFDKGENL